MAASAKEPSKHTGAGLASVESEVAKMGEIISFVGQKGGTGKSTLARAFAVEVAKAAGADRRSRRGAAYQLGLGPAARRQQAHAGGGRRDGSAVASLYPR